MKRSIIILLIGLSIPSLIALSPIASSPVGGMPSVYLDDSYYWPLADTIVPVEPMYDRNAREFIFLDDTTQYPDTVRMRIVEK